VVAMPNQHLQPLLALGAVVDSPDEVADERA
jgi:hypothetical protein